MEAFDSTSGLLWSGVVSGVAFAPNINHGFMSKMTPTNIQRGMGGMGGMSPNEDYDKSGFENVLVFRFLHCFTDGVGGMFLIKDFIDVLNYMSTGNDNTTKIQHPSQDLYACIEKPSFTQTICMWLLSLPVQFVSNIPEKRIKRPNLPEESDGLRLGGGVKYGGKWRLNVIHLTESETLRLRESCKFRGCTMQGLFEAAVGTALTRVLTEPQVGTNAPRINFNIPVDLRRRLTNPDISPSVVGNYFGDTSHALFFDMDMDPGNLAETSRNISNLIQSDIRDWKKLVHRLGQGPVALVDRIISTWDRIAHNIHHSGRNPNDVLMSNLGVFPGSEHTDQTIWPIVMFWNSNVRKVGAVWVVSCVTFGNKLSITVSTEQNIMPEQMYREFIQGVRQALRVFLGGEVHSWCDSYVFVFFMLFYLWVWSALKL